MAKPMADQPGSAMHIHQSVVDSKTGQNVFSTEEGGPSQLFFAHIAGLQKYLPAAMSLFAPNVNSYRRITRYNMAPIQPCSGATINRTAACACRPPRLTTAGSRTALAARMPTLTSPSPPRSPAATWA